MVLFLSLEHAKFGGDVRGLLFIQLANFPVYYLVLIATDAEFRFALVSTRTIPDHPTYAMVLDDIGWLDYRRIHTEDIVAKNCSGEEVNTFVSAPLNAFGPFEMTLGLNRCVLAPLSPSFQR